MNWQDQTSAWLAESSLRAWVLDMLMTVPGLPPIVQAVHIAAVAMVMGSVVFVALRLLGLAVPSQAPQEMLQRLMPWLWWALLALFLSGSVFVIARPDRYFYNPIAGWKLSLLMPALAMCLLLHLAARRRPGYWQDDGWRQRTAQGLSLLILLLLGGVVFAGRWIAYVDYLYWE